MEPPGEIIICREGFEDFFRAVEERIPMRTAVVFLVLVFPNKRATGQDSSALMPTPVCQRHEQVGTEKTKMHDITRQFLGSRTTVPTYACTHSWNCGYGYDSGRSFSPAGRERQLLNLSCIVPCLRTVQPIWPQHVSVVSIGQIRGRQDGDCTTVQFREFIPEQNCSAFRTSSKHDRESLVRFRPLTPDRTEMTSGFRDRLQ